MSFGEPPPHWDWTNQDGIQTVDQEYRLPALTVGVWRERWGGVALGHELMGLGEPSHLYWTNQDVIQAVN